MNWKVGQKLGALFVFSVALNQSLDAAIRYDAYLGNVSGSSRVVGLAGACLVDGGDVESSFFNPAALSWMERRWDGDLSFGFFNQGFKAKDDFVSVADKTFFFAQMGVAHRFELWNKLAIGLGIQIPYGFSLSGTGDSDLAETHRINFDFDYSSLNIPISFKVREGVSVGFSLKSTLANMRFSSFTDGNATLNEQREVSAFGFGIDAGVIYEHDSRQRYSLVYHWGERLGFDALQNIEVIGFDPFREAQRPHKMFLGSSYRWNRKLQSFHNLGIIFGMSDTVVPGSGISSNIPMINSGRSLLVSYHLGLEYEVMAEKLWLRAGHYFQPARSELDPQRFHVTFGSSYRVWWLELSGAIDWAKDYYNLSLGVGPHLAWGGAKSP